ncbi:hypothetical protein IW262DRAFT_1292297 [Armillaria fumosa]|nr:hypothetical protein IW262DRAFT_1292297 [Armillaria fumosa]
MPADIYSQQNTSLQTSESTLWFLQEMESKAWAKANNICASQEVMLNQLKDITHSADVFAALHLPFPEFLLGKSSHTYPQAGVIKLACSASISLDKSFSLIGGSRNSTIHQFRAIKHIVSLYIRTGHCTKLFNGYRLESHTSQTLIIMDLVPTGNTDNKVSQAVAVRMDVEASHNIQESELAVPDWNQQHNEPESGPIQAADSMPASLSTSHAPKRRQIMVRPDRVWKLCTLFAHVITVQLRDVQIFRHEIPSVLNGKLQVLLIICESILAIQYSGMLKQGGTGIMAWLTG